MWEWKVLDTIKHLSYRQDNTKDVGLVHESRTATVHKSTGSQQTSSTGDSWQWVLWLTSHLRPSLIRRVVAVQEQKWVLGMQMWKWNDLNRCSFCWCRYLISVPGSEVPLVFLSSSPAWVRLLHDGGEPCPHFWPNDPTCLTVRPSSVQHERKLNNHQ